MHTNDVETSSPLARPLALPCGALLGNRVAKAAMSEQLADHHHRPTARLIALYRRWATSGAGLLITGNVMIAPEAVSEPRQVVIAGPNGAEHLERWVRAARSGGAHVWVQLNHAGRQVPRALNPRPLAPSAVPVRGPKGAFGTPAAMTDRDIHRVIDQFRGAAASAVAGGFTGVQIHAAHGYLLSQFLSPATNQRDDRWGGDAERRRRLLGEVVGAVRNAIGPAVPLSVKLNSADFQRHGTQEPEAAETAVWLGDLGVDLLEISGGTFEATAMAGTADPRTGAPSPREAYFWTFASEVRAQTSMPLMLTGGFRSADAMQAAVRSGTVDVIGLARPLALAPDAPSRLLGGTSSASTDAAPPLPRWCTSSSMLAGLAEVAWHTEQLRRLGDGRDPVPAERFEPALARYATRHLLHTARARLGRLRRR